MHHITHHQLGNGKGEQHPVPHNARLDALCILLHFAEGGFAAVFGNGGNQGGQRNGNGNPHGFKPILVAEKEDDVDSQRQQQDLDDGIAKIGQQLGKKAGPFLRFQLVAAMLAVGSVYLFFGKP